MLPIWQQDENTNHHPACHTASGAIVKLGQDDIHFSCVWFVSEAALRAAISSDPGVPSNQHPTKPRHFHTLYIKAALHSHQLNTANRDRQSSPSFAQSAASGVTAVVVKLWSLLPWEKTMVQMMTFFCVTSSLSFSSRATKAWFVVHLHTFIFHFLRLYLDICEHIFLFSVSLSWLTIFSLCFIALMSLPVPTCTFLVLEVWEEVKCMGPTMIKCAENNRVDPTAGAGGLQHLCLFGTDLCVYDRFTAKVLRALTARKPWAHGA